ncbi:hypothetical protein EVAR_75446_1 [Eumeta japonica]|uniref:Uncharacterized protein n=1 Tax=Eumeta variegata TaxID=151549 RepID=A0A4C1TK10_EUMVA|nr:hypothetical protein EVAR_75446_1 [Eumeta japonica]
MSQTPSILHNWTEASKTYRVTLCNAQLTRFKKGTSNFVWNIVTDDETCIYCYNPKTKQRSTVWVYRDEPKGTKAARERSASKRMIASSFDKTGHVATVGLENCRTVSSYRLSFLRRLQPSGVAAVASISRPVCFAAIGPLRADAAPRTPNSIFSECARPRRATLPGKLGIWFMRASFPNGDELKPSGWGMNARLDGMGGLLAAGASATDERTSSDQRLNIITNENSRHILRQISFHSSDNTQQIVRMKPYTETCDNRYVNTSLHSTEPLRETLCLPALRDRFDSLFICSNCFFGVCRPLSSKFSFILGNKLKSHCARSGLYGRSLVSLYREPHSTDASSQRCRGTSLMHIVSELVKPVINGSMEWSFIMKGQTKHRSRRDYRVGSDLFGLTRDTPTHHTFERPTRGLSTFVTRFVLAKGFGPESKAKSESELRARRKSGSRAGSRIGILVYNAQSAAAASAGRRLAETRFYSVSRKKLVLVTSTFSLNVVGGWSRLAFAYISAANRPLFPDTSSGAENHRTRNWFLIFANKKKSEGARSGLYTGLLISSRCRAAGALSVMAARAAVFKGRTRPATHASPTSFTYLEEQLKSEIVKRIRTGPPSAARPLRAVRPEASDRGAAVGAFVGMHRRRQSVDTSA